LEEMVRGDEPFSVLLVVLRNLDGLQNCHSANVIASAVRGFQARFENIVPSSAMVGRWAKDQFAAVLTAPPADAIEMSNGVVRRLSEPFVEPEQDGVHSVVFSPRAGVIEFRPGSGLAKFQAKIQQMADALMA
jgi:GGDEF domain-containing protein